MSDPFDRIPADRRAAARSALTQAFGAAPLAALQPITSGASALSYRIEVADAPICCGWNRCSATPFATRSVPFSACERRRRPASRRPCTMPIRRPAWRSWILCRALPVRISRRAQALARAARRADRTAAGDARFPAGHRLSLGAEGFWVACSARAFSPRACSTGIRKASSASANPTRGTMERWSPATTTRTPAISCSTASGCG